MEIDLAELGTELGLGALLRRLEADHGGYRIEEHWTQGEFHHDVVLRLADERVLVVATNCNGGVKELLSFDEVPDRWALWRWRCPDNHEFEGELPPMRGRATTMHYFDPCELLAPDARSELRPEARRRVRGGGWELDPDAIRPRALALDQAQALAQGLANLYRGLSQRPLAAEGDLPPLHPKRAPIGAY